MNVQQIEYVISLSKLKNFGKAAKSCFISQSTLSTMVAKFEEEIGITIFDRKRKPLTVTKEGETIINQLKVISKEIENLHEVIHVLKGELVGDLRIGAIPTVAPFLFPLFLYEFSKNNPKIHFEISEIPTAKVIDYLVRRDLDIGIVSTPINHPDIIEIPLYNEPFFLFDKANSDTDTVRNLSDIDFDRLWLLEEGHCMRTQVERICDLSQEHSINGNLNYKSGTINTLMKFVNQNNGVTLLPYLATLELPETERIYVKSFIAPTPVRTIGLVVHKHFVKKEILNLLKKEIQHKIKPIIGDNEIHQKIVNPL